MGVTNQVKLQNIVQSVLTNTILLREFGHYHVSVQQKLWSLQYFQEEIAKLEPKLLYKNLPTQEAIQVDQYVDRKQFGLYANLYLDAFLVNAMATLDTLAHEITVLYKFTKLPDKIYIPTIHKILRCQYPNHNLTKYLSLQLNYNRKDWFYVFKGYRNCTTHESLITSKIRRDEDLLTGQLEEPLIILPDNPKKRPFTFINNRELKHYCHTVNKRILKIVRQSYYCIIKDINLSHNTVPVP